MHLNAIQDCCAFLRKKNWSFLALQQCTEKEEEKFVNPFFERPILHFYNLFNPIACNFVKVLDKQLI